MNINLIKDVAPPIDNCAGIKAKVRYFDERTSHLDGLDISDSDRLESLVAQIHLTYPERLIAAKDGNQRMQGLGGVVLIGYDSEWVENDETLVPLSYQFHVIAPVGEFSAIFFPESERLAFRDMFAILVGKARDCGALLDFPTQVVLVGFFLRADLAMFSDLVEFKHDLQNVGGKIATTRDPVEFEMQFRTSDLMRPGCQVDLKLAEGILVPVPVSFTDVSRHAPVGRNLASLGEMLGLPKVDLKGYDKAQMDQLLRANPDLFERYALRDAEIAVKYYLAVWKFARENVWKK